MSMKHYIKELAEGPGVAREKKNEEEKNFENKKIRFF